MHSKRTSIPAHVFILIYLLLCIAVLLLLPWIGAEKLSWEQVLLHLQGDSTADGLILLRQRLPRILLAIITGGALAMTGAALQVLFRNPLAEPWTLGISGGAAIGAFAGQLFPAININLGPFNSVQGFALLGAAGAMLLVWSFAQRPGTITTHTLLLAGVTISIVSGGIMMLMAYFVSPFQLVSFHRWMMGGFDVIGYREVVSLLVLGLPGLLLLGSMAREYNHLAFSEEMALGHGVDVARVQKLTFIGAGLATAACVSVAGPIGFIGMVVPHIVRNISGYDYRVVLPGAFLLGGTLLAVCDGIARTVIAPTEIPAGIITAIIGGPVFLYLLARKD